MNAERLHVIARALKADFEAIQLQKNINQLITALQNQVKQPAEPKHQQQLSHTLAEFWVSCETSKANEFTPAWLDIVKEIGGEEFIGKRLQEEVRGITERNNITPSVALQELEQINSRFKLFMTAINQLCASMGALNIGHEQLESGECEVGVVVPRNAVDNALEDFGKELVQINKIFSVFSEIATDSRENFKIRTISSSDLTVFLEFIPEIAACTALAIERIVALYKQLLEIRELRSKMEENGVSKENLSGVDQHANTLMEDGIQILVEDLIRDYHKNPDEARKNELRVEAKYALNRLAKRIDKGYGIDVRIEPYIGDENIETDVDDRLVETILQASKNIQYVKPAGEPILTLPDSEDA